MSLFRKKQEENKTEGCSCGGNCNTKTDTQSQDNNTSGSGVKVLGSGCKKCNDLEANTVEALKQLGMDTKIEHVTDFIQISAYGVMSTPALVVDGKVASYGKVLKTDEVVKILQNMRGI